MSLCHSVYKYKSTDWPLPRPPHREGRDYRDTPTVLLFVVYGVSWSRVNHCPAHFVSYIIHNQILVNGVYSVIICLYVIMSLYIKFSFSMYVSSVSVTYMKSRGCRLRWRRALSSIKKGVFLDVEGHVLEWRRACSWNEWGSGERLLWL